MYRPDDWKNPYPDPDFGGQVACVCPSIEQIAAEVGADAILEALKKSGKYCVNSVGKPPKHSNKLGWLVFIPEEV